MTFDDTTARRRPDSAGYWWGQQLHWCRPDLYRVWEQPGGRLMIRDMDEDSAEPLESAHFPGDCWRFWKIPTPPVGKLNWEPLPVPASWEEDDG